jgi:hypothetical protein
MRALRGMCGLSLTVLGVCGVLYSLHVACAKQRFYSLQYGTLTNAPADRIAAECEIAHSDYPHNYFLSIFAIDRLRPGPVAGGGADGGNSVGNDFTLWYERGLDQNPYHWKLRLAKSRQLAMTSPRAAAEHWAEFTQWQFWSPRNLGFLVDFYAHAGQLAEASELVSLLEGREGHARAAASLKAAWARELYGM